MLDDLGFKIRQLREEKGLTREQFCEDESELSVRQLARIETGQCLPSLERIVYIANRLDIKLSTLTDGESFELPKGYQDLKYQILRIPVFTDSEKIKTREEQYDEIMLKYYDQLPEDEKLIIDSMQSMLDVQVSEDATFGMGLLEEYFDQVKLKKNYRMNDLILIDLYFYCIEFDTGKKLYDPSFHDQLLDILIEDEQHYGTEELFIVNRILISLCEYFLMQKTYLALERIVPVCKRITDRIQDLQRMPIVNLVEWKYWLFCKNNREEAEKCYDKAMMFAKMTEDAYLKENLTAEWQNDIR